MKKRTDPATIKRIATPVKTMLCSTAPAGGSGIFVGTKVVGIGMLVGVGEETIVVGAPMGMDVTTTVVGVGEATGTVVAVGKVMVG